jgi:hypothetical protein
MTGFKRPSKELSPEEYLPTERELTRIDKNFKVFKHLAGTISEPDVNKAIGKLLETYENRIPVCPASTKLEFTGAFWGGQVALALRTATDMAVLNESFGFKVDRDDIILIGLFHGIGKIGTKHSEYYTPNTLRWSHETHGHRFSINPELSEAAVGELSLALLSEVGCPLTYEQIQAIQALDRLDHSFSGAQFYRASALVQLVQTCARKAAGDLRGKDSLLQV